jgi:hypothetical protein
MGQYLGLALAFLAAGLAQAAVRSLQRVRKNSVKLLGLLAEGPSSFQNADFPGPTRPRRAFTDSGWFFVFIR